MNQTNWAISKVQNILNYCFPSPWFSVVFSKLKHCSEKRFWSSPQTFIDATFIASIFLNAKHVIHDCGSSLENCKLNSMTDIPLKFKCKKDFRLSRSNDWSCRHHKKAFYTKRKPHSSLKSEVNGITFFNIWDFKQIDQRDKNTRKFYHMFCLLFCLYCK